MTLELTPDEYTRLLIHDAVYKHRSKGQRKISSEKEAAIVHSLKNHISNMEIRRKYQTSDSTINEIKKKYGLWGA